MTEQATSEPKLLPWADQEPEEEEFVNQFTETMEVGREKV